MDAAYGPTPGNSSDPDRGDAGSVVGGSYQEGMPGFDGKIMLSRDGYEWETFGCTSQEVEILVAPKPPAVPPFSPPPPRAPSAVWLFKMWGAGGAQQHGTRL